MPINDNDPALPAKALADAHGSAALLLIESLIHGLCEKGVLTPGEAVEIVERAADVQRDFAETSGGTMWRSHALLAAIAASLRTEDPAPPATPRPVA